MDNTLKKTILIIDWSNLMFRSLCLNALYGTTGKGTNYDSIDEMKSFIYKFAIDVCALLNIFKVNRVLIATDSPHAWRKDIELGEIGYKGNRQRQGDYNWDNIFKCADDLQSYFIDNGCDVLKVEHGEADDVIALCKEIMFERYPDYNIIIVSADADLRQLIDFNPLNNQYCIVYNTTTKGKTGKRFLYGTKSFLEWLNKEETVDIFFQGYDGNRKFIKDILRANGMIELAEEDPNDILINKIFCGDDGDSVPAFYSWYNNGKCFRITPNKTKKICEQIGIINVQDIITAAYNGQLRPVLEKVCNRKIEDIDIIERLNRQRLLVELDSQLFPENIRLYKADIEMMLDNIKVINYPIKAQKILENTPYAGVSKKKAIEADIFKDLAKYTSTTIDKPKDALFG